MATTICATHQRVYVSGVCGTEARLCGTTECTPLTRCLRRFNAGASAGQEA